MSSPDSDFRPTERFGKITGRHALIGFVAFFAIVFGMNGVMVFQALSTFDGVEIEGAYQKGRTYNHVLNRMDTQKRLGWSADIATRPLPGTHGTTGLSVTFADADGAPLDGLTVHGTFWRPVAAGSDQRMVLTERAPGTYENTFDLAYTGNWLVRIAASDTKGETFIQEKRVVIRE
mgnify:CR=1 FL=1